ncbi:hypothetical protein DM02DRAFT_542925, partial [Periconia macrospinosa]
LNKVKFITIIDVIITFNKVYIKKSRLVNSNKYKIVFFIYYSFYKYLVIPFRLYNIPNTF